MANGYLLKTQKLRVTVVWPRAVAVTVPHRLWPRGIELNARTVPTRSLADSLGQKISTVAGATSPSSS
jgi:hypothetical protein